MAPGIGHRLHVSLLAAVLGMALAATPMRAIAQPGLSASFLSAGLSEALNRLGAALDGQTSTPTFGLNATSSTVHFQPLLKWSVSLSGELTDQSPGQIIFSSDNPASSLTPVTQVDANPAHEAHSLLFEVSVPREVPLQNQPQPFKVFALELAAADAATALQAGFYSHATATVESGQPRLDVFLGADSCHSATRDFTIDELTYSAGQVATLVARLNCGQRFHGVLRYEDVGLTGTPIATYQGQVWEDEDADGIQAGDGMNRPDGLLSDVRVHLLRDGVRVATTQTDSVGRYRFKVPLGTYQVEVEPPRGLVLTARDVGSDENRDSDVDPQTGRSAAVPLNEGLNPGLTIGLGHPGGRGTLPLASTALQPLRVGDRTTYCESDGGVAYGTDTVLPGGSSVNGSPTRRVRDRAGNLLFLSNDVRGLRLHRADAAARQRSSVQFRFPSAAGTAEGQRHGRQLHRHRCIAGATRRRALAGRRRSICATPPEPASLYPAARA